MANAVSILLEGDEIPLSKFIAAASHTLGILAELDRTITGEHGFEWIIVDLSPGSANVKCSPLAVADLSMELAGQIVQRFVGGMAEIERGVRPTMFTEAMLDHAKRVTNLIGDDVRHVTFRGEYNGSVTTARVTQRLAANVDDLLGPTTEAIGSVEGRVETLSIHGGAKFNVYDALTGRAVTCYCDESTLESVQARRLGGRILVAGTVRYNRTGQITSVKAQSIRWLRERWELPQPEDIRGLLKGMDVVGAADIRACMRGELDDE